MMFQGRHLEVLRRSMAHPGRWKSEAPATWIRSVGLGDTYEIIEGTEPLDRNALRRLCNDTQNPLSAYLHIMAWGRQRASNARLAWNERRKIGAALAQIREKSLSRSDAFDVFTGAGAISGLGVAYFTKLLYFLSPKLDRYILDQWTAKSINLLLGERLIPLDSGYVSKRTTGEIYRRYCEAIDALGTEIGVPGEKAEELLLSQGGRKPAPWRRHVLAHYPRQ